MRGRTPRIRRLRTIVKYAAAGSRLRFTPRAPRTGRHNPRAILARVRSATTLEGGPAVSLYVMLSTLSESGRKVLRERPGWIRKVNGDVRRMGARVVAQYAVLGPYDFVTIVEAPDNATISRVSVELGARGGSAGMTMAAIPLDEFIERLEGGDKGRGKKKR
jgi:uncharacterized protein with GYD domain